MDLSQEIAKTFFPQNVILNILWTDHNDDNIYVLLYYVSRCIRNANCIFHCKILANVKWDSKLLQVYSLQGSAQPQELK